MCFFVCILLSIFGGADPCANQCLILRDAHAREKVARCVIAQPQYQKKKQSGRAFPVCRTRSSRGNREKKHRHPHRKGVSNTFSSDSDREKKRGMGEVEAQEVFEKERKIAIHGEKEKNIRNTIPMGGAVAASCSLVDAFFPFTS